MAKKKRGFAEIIILGIILLLIIAVPIGVFVWLGSSADRDSAYIKNLKETGPVAQGIATKTRDHYSIGDTILGVFGSKNNYAVTWTYTVDGQEYASKGEGKVSADVFDLLDGEDRDGQAPITVRYDPEKPDVEEFSIISK